MKKPPRRLRSTLDLLENSKAIGRFLETIQELCRLILQPLDQHNLKRIPKQPPTKFLKRSLWRSTLMTTSWNIAGVSVNKVILFSDLCNRNDCDILVLQETYRGPTSHRPRPKVQGMRLVLERPHKKHGSAIFVKQSLDVLSVTLTCEKDIEILTIE